MTTHALRSAAATVLSLSVWGCAVGPNYKRPMVTVPERFYGDEREAAALADARSLRTLPGGTSSPTRS